MIGAPGGPAALDADPWTAANKQRLEAALAEVRAALERHLGDAAAPPARAHVTKAAATPVPHEPGDEGRPFALDHVVSAFGLSPFERDLLVLCAGVELDGGLADLCARANGDPSRGQATFSIALAALAGAHWSALVPSRPLRRWRLVEPAPGPLASAPLRIDERVLHYLVGIDTSDERLAGYVDRRPALDPLEAVESHRRLARRIVRAWTGIGGGTPPVIELAGGDGPSKRVVVAEACRVLGLRPASMRAESLPVDSRDLDGLIRLCERELALAGTMLCLDCDAVDPSDAARTTAIGQLVDGLAAPLVLLVRDRRATWQRPAVTLEVRKPTAGEQLEAWSRLVGPERLDGHASRLVSQFDLGIRGIAEATGEAMDELDDTAAGGEPGLGAALWDAARARSRPRMDALAQRVEGTAGWVDLVLPEGQLLTLRQLTVQARNRTLVHDAWGFGATGSRGLGIAALFVGASGTGKTLAAEVLANELRLDLYRIDLSQVVSKYIGETEKNLRRVFDAAEDGGAILLFDEADALFGKRSEVKDSHDRYANIEVGYLLQRMEAYRGLAVLTTNMKESIDAAFLRRIRFTVHFPFPDAAARAEIWRRTFPAPAPTRGIDVELLARLNVAGGNIRNIALNAAFLAADEGEPIGMDHVLRATRTEYAKLDRTLTDAEVTGWT